MSIGSGLRGIMISSHVWNHATEAINTLRMIHEKDALLNTSPTPSRVFNTLDDPQILPIISLSQILKQFKVTFILLFHGEVKYPI